MLKSSLFLIIVQIFSSHIVSAKSCRHYLETKTLSYTTSQLSDARLTSFELSAQLKIPYTFIAESEVGFFGLDKSGQIYKVDPSGQVSKPFKINLNYRRDDNADYQKVVVSENGRWMAIVGLKTIIVDLENEKIFREIDNYKSDWMVGLVFTGPKTIVALDKSGLLYKLNLEDPNLEVQMSALKLSGVVDQLTEYKNLLVVTGAFGNMILVDKNTLAVVRTVSSGLRNEGYSPIPQPRVATKNSLPTKTIIFSGTNSKGDLFVVTEDYPFFSVFKMTEDSFLKVAEIQQSEFDHIYNWLVLDDQLVFTKWRNGDSTVEYKALYLGQF